MAPDEKQLWEEYDKWFFGKGISDYGTKMFGFMAAKWVHSFYAERIAELEQDRTRLSFARHRIDDLESRMAMAPAVEKEASGDDDARNRVTLDRRDLWDCIRGAIYAALNDKIPEDCVISWAWEEATNRTMDIFQKTVDAASPTVGDSAVIPKLKPPKYHLDENGEMVRGAGDSAGEPMAFDEWFAENCSQYLRPTYSAADVEANVRSMALDAWNSRSPAQTANVRAMTDEQTVAIGFAASFLQDHASTEFGQEQVKVLRTLLKDSK